MIAMKEFGIKYLKRNSFKLDSKPAKLQIFLIRF